MVSKQVKAAGLRPENRVFGCGRFYNVARCLSRPMGP
jgi:hypothetical protein